MSLWKIRKKISLKSHIPRSAQIDKKALISGQVFIGENVSIGTSKITSENDYTVKIGKDTTIRDCVFISTHDSKFDFHESDLKKVRDIFIGSKVFISGEVSIHGPVIISDGTFIGHGATIVNSKIGLDCLIEDGALVKDVLVPANTVIPSKLIIDSIEKLNELLSEQKLDYSGGSSFAKAG